MALSRGKKILEMSLTKQVTDAEGPIHLQNRNSKSPPEPNDCLFALFPEVLNEGLNVENGTEISIQEMPLSTATCSDLVYDSRMVNEVSIIKETDCVISGEGNILNPGYEPIYESEDLESDVERFFEVLNECQNVENGIESSLKEIPLSTDTCSHLVYDSHMLNEVTITTDRDNVSDRENVNQDPDYEPVDDDEDTESDDLINKNLKRKTEKQVNLGTIDDDKIIEPKFKKRKYNLSEDHPIRESCRNCKRKCVLKINEIRRKEIWGAYWNLTYNEKRQWLFSSVKRKETNRQTTPGPSRRKMSYEYVMKDGNGVTQTVCKVFFLGTLGYHPKNDKMINTVMKLTRLSDLSPPSDKRGAKEPSNKITKDPIKAHIETFNPCVSHYRRVHAPNRRYLPSDISIRDMYNDYKSSATEKCSYDTYRKVIKDMKISFAKLGEEECEVCLQQEVHVKSDHKDENITDCDKCSTWKKHHDAAASSRAHYQRDASCDKANEVIRSVDLQKVIMLPRMPGNKTAIFTKRIIAFNETFAAVGNQSKKPPYKREREGIGGRMAKEVASAFVKAIKEMRDAPHIILWLDNCTAQNKNWYLITALLTLVNHKDILADDITLKYFEPGHTFMSADSVHHLIEQQMNRQPGGKVLDFPDFVDVVSKCSNVEGLLMLNEDFQDWIPIYSAAKMKRSSIRLTEMVEIQFRRDSLNIFYKLTHDDPDFAELDFTKKGVQLKIPKRLRQKNKGIILEKKTGIVEKLCPLMPENRKKFWTNLEIDKSGEDPITEMAEEYRD